MYILSFYLLITSSALRLDSHIPTKLADSSALQDENSDPNKHYVECQRDDTSYMAQTGPNPFSKIQRLHDGLGFNPALTVIPNSIANQIHPEAFYVLATKLSHNQCATFCYPKKKVSWRMWTKKPTQYASAISVLDRNMKLILGPIVIPGGEDMRLLAVDGIILADYHYKGANWEMRQLHLGMIGGEFGAALGSVSYGDMNRKSPVFKGQNIGLIAQNSEIYGLWWLNNSAVKETRKITSDGKSQEVKFAKEVEAKPVAPPPKEVHNSVHPLWLPEANGYLGAAHFADAPWGLHGTKYASEYLQYLILFDSKPPFRMLKRTPNFCFPTLDAAHPGKCEVIQYVSSITRNPVNQDELVISYGLNDCESMVARVSLQTMLNLMDNVTETPSVNFAVQKFVRTSKSLTFIEVDDQREI